MLGRLGKLADQLSDQPMKCVNTANFSNTIDVVNVKLCMKVLLFVDPLPVHTTFHDLDNISGSQQCQTVLTKNACPYPVKMKL